MGPDATFAVFGSLSLPHPASAMADVAMTALAITTEKRLVLFMVAPELRSLLDQGPGRAGEDVGERNVVAVHGEGQLFLGKGRARDRVVERRAGLRGGPAFDAVCGAVSTDDAVEPLA